MTEKSEEREEAHHRDDIDTQAAVENLPRRPRLRNRVTHSCFLATLLITFGVAAASVGIDWGVGDLHRPVDSTLRVFDRELHRLEELTRLPVLESLLLGYMPKDSEQLREAAVSAYRDLLAFLRRTHRDNRKLWGQVRGRLLVTLVEFWGLRPRPGSLRTLTGVFLVAILTDVTGALVLVVSLGIDPCQFWLDSLYEEVIWGSRIEVAAVLLDGAVCAPVFEEIACRGLVYPLLRTKLSMWPAALCSAAIFSFPHLYSWEGLLLVGWSGVIWAVAYEKSRSLLPGIAAHALNNLMILVWEAMLYR